MKRAALWFFVSLLFTIHPAWALPSKTIMLDSCDLLAARLNQADHAAGRQQAIEIVQGMRAGQIPHYVPVADGRFVPLPALFAAAFRAPTADIMLTSPDELRSLPQSVQSRRILLVTATAAPLDMKRAQQVAAVARESRIRIDVLWTGEQGDTQASLLDSLARATGGMGFQLPKSLCQLRPS